MEINGIVAQMANQESSPQSSALGRSLSWRADWVEMNRGLQSTTALINICEAQYAGVARVTVAPAVRLSRRHLSHPLI